MEKFLNPNFVNLTEKLCSILKVLGHLLQNGVISLDEFETVQSKSTKYAKNIELIMLMNRKSVTNLDLFIKILRETGNIELANTVSATVKNHLGKGTEIQGTSTLDHFSECDNHRSIGHFRNPRTNEDVYIKTLLKEKWWPEKKELVKSFYERKIGGQLMIEKLYSMLQNCEERTTVITEDTMVVAGLGGIGKTSIAKSFANHYQKEYDCIIWIDCGEENLMKSFESLARDLNIENRLELQLVELARKSFQKLGKWKCLVIYDNAECFVGHGGIRDVLPKQKNIHSIITSRNQEWGSSEGYGQISKFSMNVFEKEESVQFMANSLHAETEFTNSKLERLGELLGHLPLALQIAVSTLNNHGIKITNYIDEIVTNDANGFINQGIFDDYEITINKTMNVSLDHIKKDSNSKLTYTLLKICGYVLPDDVDIAFFVTVTMADISQVRSSLALLKKHSLITLSKKQNFSGNGKSEKRECVSIHRLLQQVIRHDGRKSKNDLEKQILRKILGCTGYVRYKLIPYIFARNHKDLQDEFPQIKTELIEKFELQHLLEARRFDEATQLSLMIHSSFSGLGSGSTHQNEFLVSQYNYAVCLRKNGELRKSLKVFESLSQILDSSKSSNCNPNSELLWTVEEDGEIEFFIQELNYNFSLINKLAIKIFANFHHNRGNMEMLLKAYLMIENNYETQKYLQLKGNWYNPLLDVLNLGLVISDVIRERSTIISEKFLDRAKINIDQFPYLECNSWSHFVLTLIKFTLKIYSKKADYKNGTVFLKLLLIARNGVFLFDKQILTENATKCKQICDRIYKVINSGQGKEICCRILSDLYRLLIGFSEHPKQEILEESLFSTEYFTDSSMTFNCSLSPGGRFRYTGVYDLLFIKFPNPELLTSLTLERMTVSMQQLYYSFNPCVNITKIILKKVKLWDYSCLEKLELPNLNHFEVEIDEFSESGQLHESVMPYLFFRKSDCCFWVLIRNLKFFRFIITNIDTGSSLIEFDKSLDKLTLQGLPIFNNDIPWGIFSNWSLRKCGINLFNVNQQEMKYCTFCSYSGTVEKESSFKCWKILFGAAALDSKSNLFCEVDENANIISPICISKRSLEIDEISLRKNNIRMRLPFQLVAEKFLTKFQNLGSLIICKAKQVVELSYLTKIETVEIHEGLIYYQGLSLERNNGVPRKQKKISLFNVTPVDMNDVVQLEINFSGFHIEELHWEDDDSRKNYSVKLTALPQNITKVTLINVGIAYPNHLEIEILKVPNIPRSHKFWLTLKSWFRYFPLPTLIVWTPGKVGKFGKIAKKRELCPNSGKVWESLYCTRGI